jgi:lysyl-tRNA synthetase, class II
VRQGHSDLDGAVSGAASITWRAAGGATALAGSAGVLVHVLLASATLVLLAAVRAILAPVPAQDGHDPGEHRRAAEIIRAHGRCSIAPFILRADKSFFFAHGGVLAYRTVRDTAVVSGDPVGPPGSAPAIVAEFLRHARRKGWDVAIMAAGSEHLAAYRALGLHVLRIGSEAVADPGAITLDGGAHKTLRKAVNRVHRRGWTVEVVPAARLRPDQVRDLAAVDAAWRRSQPRLTGFSMAMDRLWGAEEDARDLYVLGRAPDGGLHGFLRFIPYAAGLSLDAMRRVGGEPNGFNEALIVAALRHAEAAGIAEVSLNFAGFEHVMASDSVLDRRARLVRAALRLAHGRFQLERLARFNARFDPAWRPRHLVYGSYTRLPRTALRVLQAEAYVRAPSHRWRKDAWLPAERPGAPVTTATGGAG